MPVPLADTVPPRPPGLIRDYVRHVGGNPRAYKGIVPPHFFPQWGFPLLSRLLEGLPYDLTRVLNAGASFEVRKPLPAGEPLMLKASLDQIDDNERRVLIVQRLETGTESAPDALVATVTAVLPRKRKGEKKDDKKDKARNAVPIGAREIARWRIPADAGLEFAVLTGDFNPIHWIPAAARAAGFKNCILHGFSCIARTVESLNQDLWLGDIHRLARFEARLTRPLVLPARVSVYIDGKGGVFVGDAPGATAYLMGQYAEKEEGA